MSVSRRWTEQSAGRRSAVVAVAAVDVGLRIGAMVDLVRRPATEVRGSKAAWGFALALVSSAGLLPVTYFLVARRPRTTKRSAR